MPNAIGDSPGFARQSPATAETTSSSASDERARLARHGESAAERAGQPAEPSRQRAAAARGAAEDERADPLGMRRQHPHQHHQRHRRQRRASADDTSIGAQQRAAAASTCRRTPRRRSPAARARRSGRARAPSRSSRSVADALSPSWRASRYGRSTSPARAGSTPSAANPMTVVRNAVRNRVGPIGAQQVLPATRADPVRRGSPQTTPATSRSTRARRTCAQTSARFAWRRNHAKRAIARTRDRAHRTGCVRQNLGEQLTQYIRLVRDDGRCCCVRLRALESSL